MAKNEDYPSYDRYSRDNYSARNKKRSRKSRSAGKQKKPGIGTGLKVAFGVAIVVLIALVFVVARIVPASGGGTIGNGTDFISLLTGGSAEQKSESEQEQVSLPTPYIAEGAGIKLHSAVPVENLTEILIHNASYSYACELTTHLTEATNVDVMNNHGTGRVASEQPTGDEWMTGEFIRCYRSGNAGPTMSAIDCGGEAGDTVYAPVSGKVVKVKKYDLYGNPDYKDIQIHIQPEGRKDLDVVLIHLEDPLIQEGDTVEGGVTPIAHIRDVYAYIGSEMQLKDYTAKGDNGNHTHIQINDATNKDYHGLD